MSQYFPQLYETLGGNINVNVDLSYYATKKTDTSKLAAKSDLVSLKAEIDIDVDKLKTAPVDLNKLSNVVHNVVKKKKKKLCKICVR